MSITQSAFGRDSAGRTITKYTMTNRSGASVSFIDWGAHWVEACVPDRNGTLRDVVLGFDSAEGYFRDTSFLGACVGRYANRIGKASFPLNGKEYPLYANDGVNTLHGGREGFDKKLFTCQALEEPGKDCLIFTLQSSDMEEGFPGELLFRVSYAWGEDNVLTVRYWARSTKDTVVNFTNHAYFNLAGHGSGKVLEHLLTLASPVTTQVDDGLIPTGAFLDLTGTAPDFSSEKRLGAMFDAPHPMVQAVNGLDFNYVIPGEGLRFAASLYDPQGGIRLKITTTEPGIQAYSGQGLNKTGKKGAQYGPYSGIALETQHYPDSPHHPAFPSTVLRAGDEFESVTAYAFSVK